jgi:carbamoyltransferase
MRMKRDSSVENPLFARQKTLSRVFMGTGIDALAIGNCFLRKEGQDPRLKRDYAHAFVAD